MTQKKTKPDIPTDMWLHVATDALARYVAGGGAIEVSEVVDSGGAPGVMVILPVAIDDPRLTTSFISLFPAPAITNPDNH